MNVQPIVDTVKPIVALAKEASNEEAKPTLDGIDRFIDALPKIAAVIGGIVQASQAAQQQRAAQYSAPNAPVGRPKVAQAPPGWLEMSPMQRWQNKFTPSGEISPWYMQGEAYEAAVRNEPPPSFNIPQAPHPSQRQAPQQQMTYQTPPPQQEYYAPAPAPQPAPPPQAVNEVEQAMIQQNETYLVLAANHLENMTQESLAVALDDPNKIIEQLTPYKALVPVTVSMFLRNQPLDSLVQLISARAPKTWAYVNKEGKVEQAKHLIEAMRGALA